ncbi:hypothetical protein BOX15_Mlig006409g1 [Macrostomum lignano]|uniref:Diacylglycerol kinase n=2 Tax=Macrostomum lignano TaxID=282301 RepID=A0A267DUN9_9PLAT|nr:hypothetical protein BOX15_Mlig006409g1 [Macrostomum lignano]
MATARQVKILVEDVSDSSGGAARSHQDGNSNQPQTSDKVRFLHPGYQQPQQPPSQPTWKTAVDWSDSAVNGEHIWIDTGASGDFCYVGESDCTKTGAKKKCTTCKIIIHTGCFGQLAKISFRCKPTFREGGIKGSREAGRQGELFMKHHWVHRRRQDGKCKACGKSFQQKFPFNNKEVIAISCSWCKAAYHNKVNCFMMHLIDESCNFGPHASIILPPSWVTKTPPKCRNRSSIRRRSFHKNSFKRRKSKSNMQPPAAAGGGGGACAGGGAQVSAGTNSKDSQPPAQLSPAAHSAFVIKPVASPPHVRPILVFINPRSGGNLGAKLMHKFLWLLNPRQVFDLTQHEPAFALDLFRRVPGFRILVCGGDGTAGWVLSTIDRLGISPCPPVAILPLGTGNDLARTLNWGAGYTDEPLSKILCCVEEGRVVLLDRWHVDIEPNPDCPAEAAAPDANSESGGGGRSTYDKPHVSVFNNYFSLGADAAVALEFHESREANPERFSSRLRNMMFYAGEGSRSILRRPWRDLSQVVLLECDGANLTDRIRELRVTSILFLNIPKYSAGAMPWGNPTGSQGFEPQRPDDGYVEVIGFSSSHLATVQMGWHGHRICQCKHAVIRTSRVIPIQIDGEPWRLQPSVIDIRLHNQASMIQKPKRRNSAPLLADMSIDSDYGFNPTISGQPLIMERLRLQVSVVAISDYERLQYDKDLLRRASYPLGLILVEIDSDLDTVRSHIDRLAIDNSIITKSGSCKLSTNWVFLDSTTAERFFRIDKSQESLHYITDISSEDLYLLDPEFVLRTGGNELPTTVDTAQQQQQVVDDDTSPTKAELEISATGLKETQKELDDADYRCSSSEPGSPDTSVTVQTDQQQPTTPPSPQPPSVEVARQAGSILASRSALSKALIDACKRGCLDKMRALRDKGADLGAADSAGMTCLHHATRFGYRDIVAYLVEHGPPQLLDQADLEKGQTALHKASWYQRRQICQLLVQAGASLTVVDSAGLTPRQQACKADDKDLAQWLEGQEHTQLVRKENQETTV